MKLRTLTSAVALIFSVGMGLSAPARAQAPDPCTVFICMAGMSGAGSPGGAGCTAAIQTFFSIQIWSPWFNAPATSMARQNYLMTCPGSTGANAGMLSAIISQWGSVP